MSHLPTGLWPSVPKEVVVILPEISELRRRKRVVSRKIKRLLEKRRADRDNLINHTLVHESFIDEDEYSGSDAEEDMEDFIDQLRDALHIQADNIRDLKEEKDAIEQRIEELLQLIEQSDTERELLEDQLAQELQNPLDVSGFFDNPRHYSPLKAEHREQLLSNLPQLTGIYFIFQRFHDNHFKALYVGKGKIRDRFSRTHWKEKLLPRVGADIVISWFLMENRFAKYYEQIFLDFFDFLLNKAENNNSEIPFIFEFDSPGH